MNATYFVLVSVLLTFATGFFVASIIWGIKWVLLSRDERSESRKSVHLLHIFSKQLSKREFAAQVFSSGLNANLGESANNKELYQYYHGKN